MENFFRESGVKWLWGRIKTLLSAKQDKLVSGENIKTINGTSVLGEGNITIEGGGDFDSSGSYPNLTAGKATKLATARKIGLTGGAVGTATNFDGSASINIPVTTLYDTPLTYKTLSDKNTEAKGLTLIDAVNGQFTANRLAFKRPDNILIEYSNDGGVNWNISSHTDETKVKLVSGIGTNLYLGNKTTGQTIQDKLRITIFAAKDGLDFYSTWQRLYVYLGTNGAEGLHCTYEYSLRDTPDNWVSQGDWRMIGWSGWNKLSYAGGTSFGGKNSSAHPFAIRLTFWFVGHVDGYENKTNACIYKLELRGTTVYGNYTGCKLAETGYMYDYDWQKNVTFPANVTATKHITQGGSANQVVLGDGSLEEESALAVASAIDAEHAQEADYAGVADKADKLTNARTISLSGGASGNVSFDGSANKSLDVTELKEAYLISGGKNITYGLSLLDCVAFGERWNNRLSFYNPDYIKVEYTNNYSEDSDGNESQDVIWTNYFEDETTYNSKQQKIHLVTDGLGLKGFELTGHTNTPCVADKSRLRVTIDAYSGRYFQIQKITTLVGRCSRNYNDQLTIERVSIKNYIDGNTEKWELVTQGQVAGDTGWNSFDAKSINYFGVSQYAASRRVRLTYIAKTSRERGLALGKICFIGNDVHDCEDNLAKTSHLYSWDSDKNAKFPAEVRGTKHVTIGGTAEQFVLGNGGLKNISDITNSLYFSVDNLVSKLTKGGNTTVNGNVVTSNGNNSDTYFTIGTSEPIDTNIPYTLGFYVEGVEEGEQWRFNVGGIVIECVNGFCWATGYFESTLDGKTSVICDDALRGGDYIITISNITLRKGTLRGYGIDAYIKKQGTNQQVVLGDGSLKALSEISPITDADADILLDNHIHNIDVYANGNDVNINVIESSKNGNSWETEDNNIPIPLATATSAGVMSKEDKAKLDGNISIEPDSGMPDFIGDFEYSDVDYEAIIDLTTVDWINWVEGGLFVMNAEETREEDNGDTSYHQCVVTFIYRANGCIPISIVNTNKMTAKMSGMVITINLTEGTGEIRFKQIKLI